MRGIIGLFLSLLLVAAGLSASPAPAQIPSYAQPDTSGAEEIVHGRILSISGAFTLTLRDDRGFIDTIALHPGTLINPSGLALAAGMVVTVAGYDQGTYLSAEEIDTQYNIPYGYVPDYASAYPYYPYWNAYPYSVWNAGFIIVPGGRPSGGHSGNWRPGGFRRTL